MSRSIGPSQDLTKARTDSRLARSSFRTSVTPRIASAAFFPFFSSRTASTTRAPHSASTFAVAKPRPLLAPVIITILPAILGTNAVFEFGIVYSPGFRPRAQSLITTPLGWPGVDQPFAIHRPNKSFSAGFQKHAAKNSSIANLQKDSYTIYAMESILISRSSGTGADPLSDVLSLLKPRGQFL